MLKRQRPSFEGPRPVQFTHEPREACRSTSAGRRGRRAERRSVRGARPPSCPRRQPRRRHHPHAAAPRAGRGRRRRRPGDSDGAAAHEGLFAAFVPWEGPLEALGYHLRVHEAGAVRDVVDPYQFGPVLTDFDLHLFAEGTHYRAWEQLGSRQRTVGTVSGAHFAVWAPNAQRVSVIGDFNRWDGRAHVMRRLVPSGVWEIFVPGLRRRHALQVRSAHPRRAPAGESRPLRARVRNAAADGVGGVHRRHLRLGRRRVDARPRGARGVARAPDVDLRGPSRLLAAARRRAAVQPVVSRAGGHPRALRPRHGLHAHRAPAGDGASVLRLVGLPGGGLLRAVEPLRHARTISATSWTSATSTAWASSSIGCPDISPRTRTAWCGSTARPCTNTKTRAAASTASGARSSSTTGATRCGASS